MAPPRNAGLGGSASQPGSRDMKSQIMAVESINGMNPSNSHGDGEGNNEDSNPESFPDLPELIHLNQETKGSPVFWILKSP